MEPDWKQIAIELFNNGHWKTWRGHNGKYMLVSCDFCKIWCRENKTLRHKKNCPAGAVQKFLEKNNV